MTQFRPCAVIPTYCHVSVLPKILDHLQQMPLHVIVVDDGNEAAIAEELRQICAAYGEVTLIRHDTNAGKGAAVLTGLKHAAMHGYTHALQVDADGQHDLTRAAELIELARLHPDDLISAKPSFDETAPRVRMIARWVTHIWVSINTLSSRIIDSMCGFRVYPLTQTLAIAQQNKTALRMGFDTEILVRLRWQGAEVVTMPVRVIYPEGNHSNFGLWDNLEISRMHARLFFAMLVTWPAILWRRYRKTSKSASHWATLAERGSALGLGILATVFQIFGRRICLAFMSPVVVFFFMTGGEQRRASRDYLYRLWLAGYLPTRPGFLLSLKQFMAFAGAALDKLAAWTGKISEYEVEGMDDGVRDMAYNSGKGAVVLTAHLGNPEVMRAIANRSGRARVNVLVHTIHAVRFNEMINAYSGSSATRLIQVTSIGPDTAILLQSAIEQGEWVVIAGDRVPVGGAGRVSWATFIGERAPFAQGPYILSALLKCPVYTLFALRHGPRFKIYFEHFEDQIVLPRGSREQAIGHYVEKFAQRLETFVKLEPLQWFNFYDFWHPGGLRAPEESGLNQTQKELVS